MAAAAKEISEILKGSSNTVIAPNNTLLFSRGHKVPTTSPSLSNSPLKSARLELHPVSKSDWEDFHLLFGNTNVMRLFGTGTIKSEEETQKTVAEFEARWKKGGSLFPFTIRTADGQFIGFLNLLDDFCKVPGHVEIGYAILDKHWGKGYALEASQMALNYLMLKKCKSKNADITTIVATAHPDNLASTRVLEKLEMHYMGNATRFGLPRAFFYRNLLDPKKKESYLPEDLFTGVTPVPTVAPAKPLIRSSL